MEHQKMRTATISYKNHHNIDGKFSRQRCLDLDPVLKKSCIWIRIWFVVIGWIQTWSISDQIRNPWCASHFANVADCQNLPPLFKII